MRSKCRGVGSGAVTLRRRNQPRTTSTLEATSSGEDMTRGLVVSRMNPVATAVGIPIVSDDDIAALSQDRAVVCLEEVASTA